MNELNLIPGIQILMDSWGSETPPEIYWGLNKLVEIITNHKNTTPIFADEDGLNSEQELKAYLSQFNIS